MQADSPARISASANPSRFLTAQKSDPAAVSGYENVAATSDSAGFTAFFAGFLDAVFFAAFAGAFTAAFLAAAFLLAAFLAGAFATFDWAGWDCALIAAQRFL